MKNKRIIITTSALISLILFNTSHVYATEENDIDVNKQNGQVMLNNTDNNNNKDINKVEKGLAFSKEDNFVDIYINEKVTFLNESEVRVLNELLLLENEVSQKIYIAIKNHMLEEYETELEAFIEVYEILDSPSEKKTIEKIIINVLAEGNEYDSKIIDSFMLNDEMKEVIIDSEESVSSSDSTEKMEAMTVRHYKAEDKAKRDLNDLLDQLLQEIRKSTSVSKSWELAQEMKDISNEDSRAIEGINIAANINLGYALRLHDEGQFSNASGYYERIKNEVLVNTRTQEIVAIYIKQANDKRLYGTAQEYYNAIRSSNSLTEQWNLALESKELFKSGQYVEEGLNFVARGNLSFAIKLHQSNDFLSAINYYDRVINEPLVEGSIRTQAEVHKKQASSQSPYRGASDYYDAIRKSDSITERWNLALESKELFKSGQYVEEGLNFAAKGNLDFAIRLHRQSNFVAAVNYYDRILNEGLVAGDIVKEAGELKQLAERGIKFREPNEYYSDILNSNSISERWILAIEFIKFHGPEPLAIEAINFAANSNLEYGRRIQRAGNITGARSYYSRINENKHVSISTRHLASVFLKQTYSNYVPTVYIDPGHGGSDPGAVSNGVNEKTLNMNVSLYLKNDLEKMGYKVIMSRKSDVSVELGNRSVDSNQLEADIFISVHHNSMGGSGIARGLETFIFHRVDSGFGQEVDRNNFNTNDPRIKESLELADLIHGNIVKDTGLYNRGVKGNNFNVLRNTFTPAVLLELGFMDNKKELSIIKTDSYQRKAANSISKGIDTYFKTIFN